jgi:hypothetical protein
MLKTDINKNPISKFYDGKKGSFYGNFGRKMGNYFLVELIIGYKSLSVKVADRDEIRSYQLGIKFHKL